MVSDAHRRRLAALEQKAAPPTGPDPERVAHEAAVTRILEIARAWQAEVPGRRWERPTPDLFERMTPEDQEVFRAIVDVCSTF